MPYAPGIEYRGDQALGAGVRGAGNNLVSAFGNYIDRSRKSKALDSVLTAYMPDGSDQQKELKKALGGMSLEEKQGMVQAHAVKEYQAKEERAKQLQVAQMEEYRAIANERKQRATSLALKDQSDTEEKARVARFQDYLATDAEMDRTISGPAGFPTDAFTPENLLRRAAQSGAMGSPAVSSLIENLQRYGKDRNGAAEPRPFKAGNSAGVWSPTTGQFQLEKDPGLDPSVAPPTFKSADGQTWIYNGQRWQQQKNDRPTKNQEIVAQRRQALITRIALLQNLQASGKKYEGSLPVGKTIDETLAEEMAKLDALDKAAAPPGTSPSTAPASDDNDPLGLRR